MTDQRKKGWFQIGRERVQLVPLEYVADVGDFLRAYARLRSHGVLPCAGGMLDQTAGFIQAVDIIDEELASYGKSA